MLGQVEFGLNDKQVQLKLFDVGPNLTLDQAITTARTYEISKRLVEQLQPGASDQAVRHKSTYKQKKIADVTAAAAGAAALAWAATATCDKCGYELHSGTHNTQLPHQTQTMQQLLRHWSLRKQKPQTKEAEI